MTKTEQQKFKDEADAINTEIIAEAAAAAEPEQPFNTDKSRWQEIMTAAYEKWHGQEWSYSTFLGNLTSVERKAVILGNYHYQVGNGGHRQWVDNGYALRGPELQDTLRELIRYPIGGTKATEKQKNTISQLLSRLTNLLSYVDLSIKEKGFYNYWKNDNRRDEYGEDEYDPFEDSLGEAAAEEMDDWYYDVVTPVLLPLVELYMVTNSPKPVEPGL